jgi:hypothetical protein
VIPERHAYCKKGMVLRPPPFFLAASILLIATRAVAQDAPDGPAPPAEPPARAEGMRLALDLSFARSTGESTDRVNAGSPSLIPLGADVSWRVSRRVLLGGHGHVGLASRDNCLGDTDCTARGYGLGAHVETGIGSSSFVIPYFRYALGWEMIHQIGAYQNADAYRYRHAFDLLDVRFGTDFVVARGEAGRTTRIGPFVGMIAGLALAEVAGGGLTTRNPEFGSGHLWFLIGGRGTMDW